MGASYRGSRLGVKPTGATALASRRVSLGTERVLSQRELNRALLERQFLLTRKKLSLPRTLERVGGLQAQYAPSMYIGLWSRLQGFERDALTRALERRTVVQGTLMRTTIHLVSAGDYWPISVALRHSRRKAFLDYRRGRVDGDDVKKAAATVRRRLEAGERARKPLMEGMDSSSFNGANVWLDLVRVPPAGTWERRRADLYALAEDWLGPAEATAGEGRELLARRYLEGFGPAAPKEIADWAGLKLDEALEEMDLRYFRDEKGGLLVDLPRAALPAPDTPAPVRFLPTWDATLLVHARRTQILPEEHRAKVFSTKTPQSMPTFTVDGQVAGSWRYDKDKMTLQPFERLSKEARAELDAEAERLAALHA
jgi:Winged helix DNA-binding domain